MDNINFITQAYEGEAHTVHCSATTLERLYPKCDFYVYDGGLSEESRDDLRSFSNVTLIDWQDEAEFATHFNHWSTLGVQLESFVRDNTYLDHIIHRLLNIDYRYLTVEWDFFMRQKPRSILDLTERVDENIFWLDADVVIVERIDELFEQEFDIGGTIRSRYAERYYDQPPINAGVLVFPTTSENISRFVREWLARIETTELTEHREQDCITALFKASNQEIFGSFHNTGVLNLSNISLRMKVLPCRTYNYFNFECGINPAENKILHFKAQEADSSKETTKQLLSDIKDGAIESWQRASGESQQ